MKKLCAAFIAFALFFATAGVASADEGIVKWFNTTKGYGFITPDKGGEDVFVHISALQQAGLETLAEGQRVSYTLFEDRRGKFTAGDIQLMPKK